MSSNADLSLSTESSDGSTALAITIHGYTEITSVDIVSPRPVRDQAIFDLKLLQDLSWGQARLIVVVPSQGHSWRDVGGVDLGSLAPGIFHTLSFDLPGDLRTALESGASDLSFKIVLNGPPGSQFILDNLVLSDDTDGAGSNQGTAYELSLPVGATLSNTALAAHDYLKIEDGVLVTGDGDFSIVNTGVGQFELGADAVLGTAGQTIHVVTGGDAFLRDRSKIFGDLSAALEIMLQSTSLQDAVLGTPTEYSPLNLDPALQLTVDFSAGSGVEHVDVGETRPLVPGHYGALILKPGATLQLSSGEYYFDSVDAQSSSTIELTDAEGPSVVYVKGAVKHQASVVGEEAEGRFLIVAFTSGRVDIDAPFRGTVFAPNAFLRLSPVDGSGHSGSFFGRTLEVGARNPIRFVPFQFWDWLSPAEVDLTCSELTAAIVDVRGAARDLWLGTESASEGRALSTSPEFEIEFDHEVRGDHPLVWFRPIECEGDVLALPLNPKIKSRTLKFVPEGDLLRGCRYRLIIARYQALGPDGACLEQNFELEFRVVAYDEAHDFVLAQREGGDGPLSYFLLRDGVNLSPEDAFRRHEGEIGVVDLDLRRDKKFELAWRDKTQWSFVQHVNGYPVRGAGYTVEVEELDGKEMLRSASGHLVTELDVAEGPSVSESQALATALGAVGSSAADWAMLPGGSLFIWADPGNTPANPVPFALAWRFDLRRSDLLDPDTDLAAHAIWIDAVSNGVLEIGSSKRRDTPLGDVPASVDFHGLGPLGFEATEWELTGGGYQIRVNGSSTDLNVVYMSDSGLFSDEMADPDGNGYFEATEGNAAQAALIKYTAQSARSFINGLELLGGTWRGLGGDGTSPLRVDFYPVGQLPPTDEGPHARVKPQHKFGDPVEVEYGWPTPENANFEVMPQVLAHEFGHLVSDNARFLAGQGDVAISGEPGAIVEGLADVFSAAYAHDMLGDPAWAVLRPYTYEVGATHHVLDRHMGDPWLTNRPRTVGDKNYGGGGHDDSTIVSHWAYLLGTGDNAIAGPCNVPVSQLVPGDVSGSMATVLRIATEAFLDIPDTATFAQFRNATEAAALRLYDKAMAARVAEAWMAVGVGGSGHAALTEFAPAAVSKVHPWNVGFSWKGLGKTWEMQLATAKADLDQAEVESMPSLSDGTVRRDFALEPGQKYWWRARVAGAASWSGCALIESSFETAKVPIELVSNTYSLPWGGGKDEAYETGYRGIVTWQRVPGAEYELFFGDAGSSACSGSPVATATVSRAALEPWDDYWSTSADDRPDDVIEYETFTSEIDELTDEIHTIGIRPRPPNTTVEGTCHEFSVHKRIIEHFTQDWPQLDSLPSVMFDPQVASRTKTPDILPPADFLFTPATHQRPGPDVPSVDAYRLTIRRSWVENNVRKYETVYDEYQDVKSHPALSAGKWEFAPASYSWLGVPAAKPNAGYHQVWQLYAVVDGQERPAALAPGSYEYIDPAPNQVLWGASDLPPGHFMWLDSEIEPHLIKSVASWDEIAATRRIEEIGGKERVVYTANWTLETDSFWEDQGVPVYAGSPAGPMSGYFLEVIGRTPETAYVEVTADNFRDAGFGGIFNDGSHPRFALGEEGETLVAAVVVATPFTRGDDDELYWAGDPTYLELNVHWVDELDDSTKCGQRGRQCCFLDNDRCDFGECGQDEPDTCSGCGWAGESCCVNDFCATGKTCDGGICVEIPECNGVIHNGGTR